MEPITFNDVENVWPSPEPSPPPPPLPTPSPPPEPERQSTPWQTLAALENERLLNSPSMMRELAYGYMYAHLQNVNVDWDLEGSTVCRVEGNGCHGHDFEELHKLEQHLRAPYHLAHNATQSPFQWPPRPRRYCKHMRQEVQEQITQSDDMAIAETTNDEIALLSEIPDSQGSITLPFTDSDDVSVQECSGIQKADDKDDDESDSAKSIILGS
ncbi:hypothetical protein J3E68DRAFT_431877 [Trichoderma sp. SZMC 28012]